MRNPADWMLSQALESLARAERLQRQFFRLGSADPQPPNWEPPVDVLETPDQVLVFIALPGVEPHEVQAAIMDGVLVVSGRRTLPPQLRTARIHRLELPQGRFERRIALPAGQYGDVRRVSDKGCVVIVLEKIGSRGR